MKECFRGVFPLGDFHRLHRAIEFDGHQLFIVDGVICDTSMILKGKIENSNGAFTCVAEKDLF